MLRVLFPPVSTIAFRLFTASAIVPWICPKNSPMLENPKKTQLQFSVLQCWPIQFFIACRLQRLERLLGLGETPVKFVASIAWLDLLWACIIITILHWSAVQWAGLMIHTYIWSRFVFLWLVYVPSIRMSFSLLFSSQLRFVYFFAKWPVIKSMRMLRFIVVLL